MEGEIPHSARSHKTNNKKQANDDDGDGDGCVYYVLFCFFLKDVAAAAYTKINVLVMY